MVALVPPLIVVLILPRSWLAALILVGTAPLIPLFMVLTGRHAAAASTRQAGALATLGGQFLDLVRGLPTLRLLGRVDAGAERLRASSDDYRQRSLQVLRIAFLSSAVLELFASIAIAMVALYLGLALLGRFDGGHYGVAMTLQHALFILLLAPEFFAPLRQLGSDYHARAQAMAAATAIQAVLERVPPARSAASAIVVAANDVPQRAPVSRDGDDAFIEFDRVTLRHANGRVAVDDASFRIAAGERVLLRGASGSGKSSVLALLAGFAVPTSGRVLVDGIELGSIARERWHRQLAWLEQRPEGFAASVRDNVLLGLDRDDEARLWNALAAAGIDADVRDLPAQADSMIDHAGHGWSGGQLQRIALARAMARDARLWLLDEPLAQLDVDTARGLRASLASASRGRTLMMASHDGDDVGWVDRVIDLQHGRVVDHAGATP